MAREYCIFPWSFLLQNVVSKTWHVTKFSTILCILVKYLTKYSGPGFLPIRLQAVFDWIQLTRLLVRTLSEVNPPFVLTSSFIVFQTSKFYFFRRGVVTSSCWSMPRIVSAHCNLKVLALRSTWSVLCFFACIRSNSSCSKSYQLFLLLVEFIIRVLNYEAQ